MADLSITSSNVVPQANARLIHGTIASVAIAAGEKVYVTSDDQLALADNDSATAAAKDGVGIAVNSGAAGQPVSYQKGGDVALGSVLTAGEAYFLSSTPGKICPAADLGSGDKVVQVGIAKSATVLAVAVVNPGVSK